MTDLRPFDLKISPAVKRFVRNISAPFYDFPFPSYKPVWKDGHFALLNPAPRAEAHS